MGETNYLVVGSSHAALEAVHAIRMIDAKGSVALVTRDAHMPYSPTVLPYVVSGRSKPERVALRDEAYFKTMNVDFVRGAKLVGLDAKARTARFEGQPARKFDRLLLATGAQPIIPPIKGLDKVPFHVLRSLDDALGLRKAMGQAKRAVVLGAGLIGMHAAENLVEAGLAISIVEMQGQVLPGYFDAKASGLIEKAFAAHKVTLKLGRKAQEIKPGAVVLDDGSELPFDLLLVSTGVKPELGYLEGSGVATERGILVDARMNTNVEGIFAAGDVAQAKLFQAEGTGVAGILPAAVEQGRIAGMAMAGDRALKPYPGHVSLNTYTFFGQQAISVGAGVAGPVPAGAETIERADVAKNAYLRLALKDNRLLGAVGINVSLDPGILWQLILRKVDLAPVMDRFQADPLAVGRVLMSRLWR